MKNKFLFIIALLFAAINTWALTPVYVNGSTGNDAWDGSSATWVSGTIGPKATIQAGIDAVSSGGTVNVAAGTYTEQINVNKNMTLTGSGAGTTTIQAPGVLASDPDGAKTLVLFTGAITAEFSGFTVQGPMNGLTFGIYVRAGATADIHDNVIKDINDNPLSGAQHGVAIEVGKYSDTEPYVNQIGTATITNNNIYGYQKSGIAVERTGSSATITGNTITGAGPITTTAQNGIQIRRGATGSVINNIVTGNAYDGPSYSAEGIGALHAGSGVIIQGNTVNHNSANIYGWKSDGIHILDNQVSDAASVDQNSSAGIGVFTDGTPSSYGGSTGSHLTGVIISGNTVQNNLSGGTTLSDGIDLQYLNGATISGNNIAGSGYDGIWIGESGNITFTNNQFSGNGLLVADPNAAAIDFGGGASLNPLGGFTVHNNSFVDNRNGIWNYDAGNVDATCNWWGTIVPSEIDAKISSNVTFVPWLLSGVDGDLVTAGFQPLVACASCNLVLSTSSTFANCPLQDGTASVSVNSGGISPYTYLWSNSATTSTITGLVAGSYTVTVTDINGCTASATATVSNSLAGPVHNTNTGLNYCTIQAAINDPLTLNGHVITVDAGTYTEQVLIQKSLTLTGAGIGSSIIKTPVTRTLSVVNGAVTWDYLVAAYPASGTINVHINGFTLDANGTINTSGTTNLAGLFMRDVSGSGAGLFSSEVHNFGLTEYTSWGIVTFRNSSLTIDGNTVGDFTRDGILVKGDNGPDPDPVTTISNNTVAGNSTALNGIDVNGGAVATINVNHVTGLTRSTPWAGGGIFLTSASSSSAITGNTVEECWDGVGITNASGLIIDGNIINNIYDHGFLVENSNNCTFTNNSISDCKTSLNAGINLYSGSTGNIIGTSGNGNTITLPVTGTGNRRGITMPNTVGSGSNTIGYNTFNGGDRFIQIDGGNTGTTTIDHNIMGDTTAPNYGAISMNGGSAIISYNTLTNSVCPMEFYGAINLDINNNTVNGANWDGINLGNVSGTKSIALNTISNCAGGAGIHCRADADNVSIECNEISLSRDGIVIDAGSTGNSITNNNIHDNTFSGITANDALATVTGNTIDNCWRGIETYSTLTAHNNIFTNNVYGSVIFHNNVARDVTNNWWGNAAGPTVYLNYPANLNTYNQANQVQYIQANANSNFTYVPWLNSGADNDGGTCGFQPAAGTSFAPVYANNNGSTTETEQYASIQSGVTNTSLAFVIAKAGTYNESQIVVLNKGLTIQGAGASVTTIDGSNAVISGSGTKPGTIYFKNPDASVKIDGFTFINPVNNTSIGEVASISIAFGSGAPTPLLVTISNNHFIGVADNGFNPFDNAIWVYAPPVGVVPNILINEFDHLWQPVLLELPRGGAVVTGNNFHDLFAQIDGVTTYPPQAMSLWEYGGVNVNAPVTLNTNTFSAYDGWSIVLRGGGSGNAQFINDVTIQGNNINTDGAGIVLRNPATTLSDAASDGIVGATISGNTITSITPGTGTGIWLRGPNNNTIITNNTISGYANGTLSEEYNAGAGTSAGVAVHLNSLTGNNTSVSNQGPSTIDATVNYWGGCPSVSDYVTYFPYYTTCTGTPGSFVFGGQINNIVANASQTTICAGSSTTIYATGGSDYVWDNWLGLGSSKVVSPATNTTYNVTAKDAHGCTGAFASVAITVNPLPVVLIEGSASGSSIIVLGSSKSLTASGATSYLWNTGSTANPITVSPTTTTIYSVIGTTGSCSASATHTVNVAIVTAGSNQFICQGGSANLNATVTGVAVTSYSWSPAESLSNSAIQNPIATPTITTTYTVTVNGILDLHAHVTVFVHPKPVANAGPDVIIASGGSGTLSGSATGGSTPYSWSWTGPSGFTSSQQNPTVNTAGTYTLIVTDAFGCVSDPDLAIVTVAISGYTVSGNIAYAYGIVNPQMHNVTVKLKVAGTTMYTAVTPASGNGNYKFLGVASGTYDVYFSLTTAWGGVTSADIVAIQKHYLPPQVLLHGIKRLAADVYGNTTAAIVNVDDRNLVNTRRLNPKCGCFPTGDWVFTKAAAIGSDPGTYIYANSGGYSNMQIIVGAGDLGQDFQSLCYGDVDASYTGLKEFDIDNQIIDVTNVDGLQFINYPNPFSDHTTLSYSLPVAGDVQICIYNLMGERIALIEKPGQTEGVYEYRWNTENLSQGIYLGMITLKIGDVILRRHIKMLLNR